MYKEYTMNQLVLPLDLEVRLPENDIAFAVHDLVEQIPDEAFETFWRTTGCPAYHPRMMMKIVLCAYTQSVFSGRKIEGLLKDSLRMMWLAQGHEPSYRTINRFRVHPDVAPILKSAFVTFRCHLVEAGEIDQEAIFIDGTKLEANANRYTFVWRKAVEKYSAALVEKSNRLYEELMAEQVIPEIERESPEALSVEELEEVAALLGEKVDAIDEESVRRPTSRNANDCARDARNPAASASRPPTSLPGNADTRNTWPPSARGTVTRRPTGTRRSCG